MLGPRSTKARCLAAGLALLASLQLALRGGNAAETAPYQVTIDRVDGGAIDGAVRAVASLVALQSTPPVAPFALIARSRADAARIAEVLHGFGYYDARIAVSLAGRPADDPDLAAALDTVPEGQEIPVHITIAPGARYRLGSIALSGDVPAGAAPKLGLRAGEPAVAADVLAGQQRLLEALRADGHALARIDPPRATLDPARTTLDLVFVVHAGPRVNLGPITIEGLDRVSEAYARRRLGLRPGEAFDPARIAAARRDLAAGGVFASVAVDPATELDTSGALPVIVRVRERKPRTVAFGAAWSTDQGGSLNASWSHRNLFGNAEQLTLSAAATQLGGSASAAPGYNLGVGIKLPDWQRRDQTLAFSVNAVREYLRAYDRTGVIAGGTLSRRFGTGLTASLGVTSTAEQILQEGRLDDYLLLQVPIALTYDSTNDPLDPASGLRATALLTPTASSGSTGTRTFMIAQVAASAYFDFGTSGRSVLALRGLVGASEGASTFSLPPDQRFYAGGSGTVRGFRYQSIGPQFASDRPTGGTAVDAGSVEFRQRIGADWGAAAFVDAGQISDTGVPFQGAVEVGAGVGVRYYSAIGPLRFDIAVPLTRVPKGDAFELYIGIGQAF